MLRLLDLFSGIGGFSLAASWTGQIETVAFCEIDPFCQKVLRKHWPEVPIIPDIREVTVERIQGIIADTEGKQAQPTEQRGLHSKPCGKGARINILVGGQIPQSGTCIRDGGVNSDVGGFLSDNPTSNVEDIDEKRVQVQRQSQVWGREPLLSGDSSLGQGAEPIRTSDKGWKNYSTGSLFDMWGIGGVQEREINNSSTSSQLRGTVKGNVAVSEMPSQTTQTKYDKGGDGTGICSQESYIDILTGGFP